MDGTVTEPTAPKPAMKAGTPGDPYLATVDKEVQSAAAKALWLVGRDGKDLVYGERVTERNPNVFSAFFEYAIDPTYESCAGRMRADGVPHVNADDINGFMVKRKALAMVTHTKPERLRGLVRTGEFGMVTLHEEHSAITTHRCDNCGGDGTVYCGGCRGHGTTRCNNCSQIGRKTCHFCSGQGGHYDAGTGSTTSCAYCWGRGWRTCSECNGTLEVRCNTCGGNGLQNCRPCGSHGYHSMLHGFRLTANVTLTETSSKWPPEETKLIREWLERGSPGRTKDASDPWMPFAGIDDMPVQKYEGKGLANYSMLIVCHATVHKISCKFQGKDASASYMNLGKHIVRFSPFLEEEAIRIGKEAMDASEAAPSELMAKLAPYKGIASILKESWSRKSQGESFSDDVSARSYGAIPSSAVGMVAAAYSKSLRLFNKSAVKNASGLPAFILASMWVGAQALGYPAEILENWDPVVLAVFSLVPAAVALVAIRFMAVRAMRKETGQEVTVKLGAEGYILPLSAAVIFGATAWWGVDLWPWAKLTIPVPDGLF